MLRSPTRVVVTGAAGFIGSHLCERLLADGHEVVGIDSFSDYYERERKEQNLGAARAQPNFTLEVVDLVDADLARILDGATVVFHLAGQPGVRPSWGGHFDRYVHDNIVATQRLLESLRESQLQKLVFASSSSVYGDAEMFPTKESALPRPVSPYGMTKLAAEHLTFVYMRNFGIPATSLRYFTVYGPRQRPDMAFCRLMEALVDNEEIEIVGDGEQTRLLTRRGGSAHHQDSAGPVAEGAYVLARVAFEVEIDALRQAAAAAVKSGDPVLGPGRTRESEPRRQDLHARVGVDGVIAIHEVADPGVMEEVRHLHRRGVHKHLGHDLHREPGGAQQREVRDRKSTRLNSSHQIISYAVFCVKKNNKL